MPNSPPDLADKAPEEDELTDYDREHFTHLSTPIGRRRFDVDRGVRVDG